MAAEQTTIADGATPVALEQAGLGIDEAGLWRVFEPFVAATLGADDPAWNDERRRRQKKLLRQAVGRALGRQRDRAVVIGEYEKAWTRIDYGMYALGGELHFVSPWIWRGRHVLASDAGATRVRQLLLSRVIEKVRPRSVLEVGSGNGINLMLAAGRFPDIRFHGIELTEAGVRAAQELQKRPALPEPMRAFGPEPPIDPTAFRRIDFRQGDATALPFPDGSVDLVYSVLALEQMERIRNEALAEMARVAAGHTLMIEPFADVNDAFWTRLNVYRRNYFRGTIRSLARHRLEPVLVTDDFPQELFLKACLVLARKVDPALR